MMKFKTDDIVWFDDDRGVVVCGYPASDHNGFSYDVYWPTTRRTGHGLWESDLLSQAEALNVRS